LGLCKGKTLLQFRGNAFKTSFESGVELYETKGKIVMLHPGSFVATPPGYYVMPAVFENAPLGTRRSKGSKTGLKCATIFSFTVYDTKFITTPSFTPAMWGGVKLHVTDALRPKSGETFVKLKLLAFESLVSAVESAAVSFVA
jgi:hypothetical protein